MKEIKIDWEGPFSIDEILKGEKALFKRRGLYQIYGFHPLYGNDVLLYIGKTEKQNFSKRLNNRYEIDYNSDAKNTNIYLGVIMSDDKRIEEQEELNYINASEALLINSLKPAYNSSNVKSAKNALDTEYIIYNEGYYKSLYPVLSSKYFWEDWKNYKILEEMAKKYDKKVVYEEEEDCFCIDEKKDIYLSINAYIWDNFGYPLQIAVPTKKKKEIEESNFSFEEHSDKTDEFLYINAADDLKARDVIEKIRKRIEDIQNII